jgi:DNA-binding SARP family transcriptional activator
VERAPAPSVTLLDGFALDLGSMAATSAIGALPRGVQRLVAHLSLCRGRACPAVAGRLWPDVPEADAEANLRSAVCWLQTATSGVLDVTGGGLALAPGVRVDIRELTGWARRMLAAGADGGDLVVPEALLSGELLPGWSDDWVLLERERLRQLRMHVLEVVAVRLAAAGRHGEALRAAHAAVREEPLRESASRVVVAVHLARGDVAEAVRTCEEFRALLLEAMGVEPTEQMTRLLCGIAQPLRAAEGDTVTPGGAGPPPSSVGGCGTRR